jgi:3-hydroxyisobutyrate dehydrogenase
VQIGFVGLGDQGTPMAERLLGAGFSLHVFARKAAVVERFNSLGAQPHGTLRELGAASDMVCVCVVDDAQVDEVVLGDNLIAGLHPGSIVVVHSTVHPETCRRLAGDLAKVDVGLLDAPVTGGVVAARAGKLTNMVGGDPDVFERCRPALEACGHLVRWMGPLGSGQIMKLVNNYFFAVQTATAYDEANFARQLGLDPESLSVVFPRASSNSWVLEHYARSGLTHLVPPHEKGRLHSLGVFAKDIRLFRELAKEAGLDVSSVDATVSRALSLLAMGGSGVIDETVELEEYRRRVQPTLSPASA